MNLAFISDVHGNIEALGSVMEEIRKDKAEKIFSIGDIVGYGPNPNECINALKDDADIIVAGNHDYAAVGMTDITDFNDYAKAAIQWTESVLSEENKAFLKELPLSSSIKKSGMLLVHASPKDPLEWEYVTNAGEADANFSFFSEKACFIGHTHTPAIIELSPEGKINFFRNGSEIKDGHRYIIDVGSVGQPRDGNPEAAYALYSGGAVEIKRVPYDILLTQKKMREAGLPSYLIERLSEGR
ncbi:MAG: metallophosphoesterase family protein [Nitrospirae bacterium]|nr:metallophosphoesterase family protein [Nitrospirota bacterium]